MSELFKSAMGYFGSTATSNVTENELVGQMVQVANVKLRIKKVIAEGGFAFVFVAQDPNTGKEYALKRLIASDQESKKNITQEVAILKQLSGHPNIIQFLSAQWVDRNDGSSECLVVTELCPGSLIQALAARKGIPLPPNQLLQVFWQACRAVQHMHTQSPPVTHRDLKIENLLISADGVIKLCDFGSATVMTYQPDAMWSANQRSLLEEEVAKVTTPMYRAPEMVDTWSNYSIGTASDVWALGCLLYVLCYTKHPFEDSAKLRILNANYTIPTGDKQFAYFHDIIRGCLKANPAERFSVATILERLASISETHAINLKEPLRLPMSQDTSNTSTPNASGRMNQQNNKNDSESKSESTNDEKPPPRPQPPRPAVPDLVQHPNQPPPAPPSRPPPLHHPPAHQPPPNAASGGGGGLFSSFKGGAGSFLKNLKDTSSKVMQTVQQSIARSEIDLSYITSRVVVMPFPAEGLESAYRTNHVEDVRALLDTRHPSGRFLVINASGRSYPASRLSPGRVIECPPRPTLAQLYRTAGEMYAYLSHDQRRVCVIHCTDGKCISALHVCSLFMYANLVERPEDAAQMFAVKRMPPSLQASQYRYLYYLQQILKEPSIVLNTRPYTLVSFTVQPVPLFNKNRDGCRPYVEVFQGEDKVKTTQIEYERMRAHNITDGKICIPLGITVCGDVTLIMFHARNTLGGVMAPTAIKITQIQLHTGFLTPDETTLEFNRSELDEVAELDHYPERFHALLAISAGDTPTHGLLDQPWIGHDSRTLPCAQTLFSTKLEMDEAIDNFVTPPAVEASNRPPPPVRPKSPLPPRPPPLQVIPNPIQTEESHKPPSPEPIDVEADLLNIGGSLQNISVTPTSTSNVDLLGGFDLTNPPSTITSTNHSANSKDFFDPFADPVPNVTVGGSTGLLGGSGWPGDLNNQSSTGMTRNASTPNLESKTKDPFADLGNITTGLTMNSKPVTPISGTPRSTSPKQEYGGHSPQHGWIPQAGQFSSTPATPHHQMRSPSGPDYSRTHFEGMNNSISGKNASNANKPKTSGDIFDDLLGSQGYTFTAKKDSGPRTINEMRKGELVKDMDPEKFKILEWVDGKTHNIRALLCTLHTVTWPDCKWNKCDMSQLVTPTDVKKAYRRACLAVHPDKQMGTDNESLARLLFIELNNAWTDFEGDASQQNLFSS